MKYEILKYSQKQMVENRSAEKGGRRTDDFTGAGTTGNHTRTRKRDRAKSVFLGVNSVLSPGLSPGLSLVQPGDISHGGDMIRGGALCALHSSCRAAACFCIISYVVHACVDFLCEALLAFYTDGQPIRISGLLLYPVCCRHRGRQLIGGGYHMYEHPIHVIYVPGTM